MTAFFKRMDDPSSFFVQKKGDKRTVPLSYLTKGGRVHIIENNSQLMEVAMSSRSKYKTKQREDLLSYLKSVKGVHVTAADVCEHFKDKEEPMSQATVYRQLERMVDEGLLGKYIIDSSSPACFEYLGKHSHHTGQTCFHCKCEKCGRLIHLKCDELCSIQSHLLSSHNFKIDPMRTVFYGLCEDCMQEASCL